VSDCESWLIGYIINYILQPSQSISADH